MFTWFVGHLVKFDARTRETIKTLLLRTICKRARARPAIIYLPFNKEKIVNLLYRIMYRMIGAHHATHARKQLFEQCILLYANEAHDLLLAYKSLFTNCFRGNNLLCYVWLYAPGSNSREMIALVSRDERAYFYTSIYAG